MAEKSARSKEVDSELTLEQVKEQLIQIGKKTGVLAYDDIAERMGHFELDSHQMDEFYEFLGDQGVELVGDNDEDADPNAQELAKGEEEFDLNDLQMQPSSIKKTKRLQLNHRLQNWVPLYTMRKSVHPEMTKQKVKQA